MKLGRNKKNKYLRWIFLKKKKSGVGRMGVKPCKPHSDFQLFCYFLLLFLAVFVFLRVNFTDVLTMAFWPTVYSEDGIMVKTGA
jgi:hypothetical protein